MGSKRLKTGGGGMVSKRLQTGGGEVWGARDYSQEGGYGKQKITDRKGGSMGSKRLQSEGR